MAHTLTRRQFVQSGTAAGVALATTETLFGTSAAIQTGVKPVVVASDNGNVYKNGGTKVGVQLAFEMITKGSDVLDALIAGVNLCELDPEEARRMEAAREAEASLDVRLAMLAEERIHAEVVYPTIGLYVWSLADAELGEACCREYNDWIGERLAGVSPRVKVAAMLPTWSPEGAIAELHRCAARGFAMSARAAHPTRAYLTVTSTRRATGSSPATLASVCCGLSSLTRFSAMPAASSASRTVNARCLASSWFCTSVPAAEW